MIDDDRSALDPRAPRILDRLSRSFESDGDIVIARHSECRRDRTYAPQQTPQCAQLRRMIDEIAAEIGETPGVLQRWLDYVVRDVNFDRLSAVYHAVAEKAELWPLEWLIGGKPGGGE